MLNPSTSTGISTYNPSQMLYGEKLYQKLDEGCQLLKRPAKEDKYRNQFRVLATDNAAIEVIKTISDKLREYSINTQKKPGAKVKNIELPSLFWPSTEKNTQKRAFASLGMKDSGALYKELFTDLSLGPLVEDGNANSISVVNCEDFVKMLFRVDKEKYSIMYKDMRRKICRLLTESKLEASILLGLGKIYALNVLNSKDAQVRKQIAEEKELQSPIIHRMTCKAMLMAANNIFRSVKTDNHLFRFV